MRADGFQFTASSVSPVDIQGRSSSKSDLIHEEIQVSNQGQDSSKPVPIREVVQLQMQESSEGYMNGDKGEEREAAILGFGLGSPCAIKCEATRGDGDGVLQHIGTLFPGEGQTREVLKRTEWSLKEEAELRSLSVDCPIPSYKFYDEYYYMELQRCFEALL